MQIKKNKCARNIIDYKNNTVYNWKKRTGAPITNKQIYFEKYKRETTK